MAVPTILVDSASGSDSAASGAGPSTALTGSAASTNGAGTVVTLDGSPDLTNVATDGSHVIYLADSTAGARNFSKITAKDNTAKTVTVADAFGASLSGKSWAIGGKRASIASSSSLKLISNNSGNGDWMPGWTIEMQSGHVETYTTTISLRRAGDLTDGPMTIRGAAGAATRPVLTFTNNGNAFNIINNYKRLCGFDVKNTNATKTLSVVVNMSSNLGGLLIEDIRAVDSTDKFWRGVALANACYVTIKKCRFHNCASHGIYGSAGFNTIRSLILANWLKDNGGTDIYLDSGSGGEHAAYIVGNLCQNPTGSGIILALQNAALTGFFHAHHNTIYSVGDDGIKITGTPTSNGGLLSILNNQISDCTNSPLDFEGLTAAAIAAMGWSIHGNNFYNNGAAENPSGIDPDSSAVNPSYPGSDDFTPASALQGEGYPEFVLGSARSYETAGAIKRQGGGGVIRKKRQAI